MRGGVKGGSEEQRSRQRWSVTGSSDVSSDEDDGGREALLSVAERFKLAFESRDRRLAPKRAKNLRQRLRREARERAAADPSLRAQLLAQMVPRQMRMAHDMR